ncbi:MAG: MarR family transcriptional regulator [Pseudomonadota bacterium]
MMQPESPENVNVCDLVNALRALQTALDQRDTAISAAHQMARSDWRCLQWLRDNGPQSPSAIRHALGLTSGSVTALLDRMEARGLVERCADPRDRRALRIALCDAATDLLDRTDAPLAQVADKLAVRWGTERMLAAERACLDLAKLVAWVAVKG